MAAKNPVELLLEIALGLMRALIEGILSAFGIAARRAILPIEVRLGTAEEVVEVRHRVLRQGRDRESAIFDGDTKATTRHWVAQQSDRIVAVASVMPALIPGEKTPRWQLRGMAVLPELQGSGIGRALLQAVHTDVNDGLWCNAREDVASFYANQGWAQVGEPFEIDGIGPHVRMSWSP